MKLIDANIRHIVLPLRSIPLLNISIKQASRVKIVHIASPSAIGANAGGDVVKCRVSLFLLPMEACSWRARRDRDTGNPEDDTSQRPGGFCGPLSLAASPPGGDRSARRAS